MELAIGLFLSITDVSILFYFIKRCLDKKVDSKVMLVLFVVLQVAANTFINRAFGYGNPLGFLIMATVAIIGIRIVFKPNLVISFILVFFGLILILVSDSISLTIIASLLGDNMEVLFRSRSALLAGAITSKIVFYIIGILISSKIINRMELLEKINLGNKGNKYIIGAILLFNALFGYTFTYITRFAEILAKEPIEILYFGLGFMLIFTLLIAYVLTRNIKLVSKELEWEYKEEILKEQRLYVENINEVMVAIRSQNHDFNHHLGCIYGLAEEKNYKKMREYIGALVDDAIEYDSFVYSPNKILNTILNVAIQKGMREKIKIDTKIDIPENLELDFMDYSIVIGNLMANAIEACKVFHGERYISIKIYEKNQNIIIKINNTKSEIIELVQKQDGTFKSTKKEKIENHGFGLKNINRIVEKYGGTSKFIDSKISFEAQIAIPF